MSAQEQPTPVRSHIGRKLLLGTAAVSAAGLLLWNALVEQSYIAKDKITGLAGLDTKTIGLYFWIAVGSALGGIARYWCSGVAARLFGETFPWGTLIINVAGSLIIGFFATLTGPDGRVFVGSTARQFVMVGLCGGYTTFSSFSLQTLNLLNEGEWLRAWGNIGGSVVLCLFAVWAGHALAVGLNAMR
jgi:fluoride exporter